MNADALRLALDAVAIEGPGDKGHFHPETDLTDQAKGARWMPGPVTLARRAGQPVRFIQFCSCPNCWFWLFLNLNHSLSPDDVSPAEPEIQYDRQMNGYQQVESGRLYFVPGQRIYHFDSVHWLRLEKEHKGICPSCKNEMVAGGCADQNGNRIPELLKV